MACIPYFTGRFGLLLTPEVVLPKSKRDNRDEIDEGSRARVWRILQIWTLLRPTDWRICDLMRIKVGVVRRPTKE